MVRHPKSFQRYNDSDKDANDDHAEIGFVVRDLAGRVCFVAHLYGSLPEEPMPGKLHSTKLEDMQEEASVTTIVSVSVRTLHIHYYRTRKRN